MMKITVIGGGAAGLFAAIFARKSGNEVLILEKNGVTGKKICATGNGRCNFTNADADNASHYYGSDEALVKNVLEQFPTAEILSFFDGIGITPSLEEDGKYFPLSGQAASVRDVLERESVACGVEIKPDSAVKNILTEKERLVLETEKESFISDRLIIACGGLAAPDTGSDGAGLAFAKKLGHTVKEPLPVIVQLKTDGGFPKRLSGLRINAGATLFVDGRSYKKRLGDVMFFDYGLSGPPVFSHSINAAYALKEKKKVSVSLDLVPSFSEADLKTYLKKRCQNSSYALEEMLTGFLNKKLIFLIEENISVDKKKKCSSYSEAELDALVKALKNLEFGVTGTKGFENAQATAGGIPLSELDVKTLRSKKDDRIAFCGEVVDVVGDCGGYNLTWAWASGFVAGTGIAK